MSIRTGCKQIDGIPHIPAPEYSAIIRASREYFDSMGFLEAYVQNHLDVLAACEDPKTVAMMNYCGTVFPLPQTNQMRLEDILMRDMKGNPIPIYTASTTSYRQEAIVSDRHDRIFSMFEFESHVVKEREGDGFQQLINLCKGYLAHLGFDETKSIFANSRAHN